tara:strand:+ start:470 stop:658 length:189 start_codon:yes stop_codon:yes gene_type:complete
MNSLKINTTDQELHDAHLFADKGRGKQVNIRRDQLEHLLIDHTSMVKALERMGVRVITPEGN